MRTKAIVLEILTKMTPTVRPHKNIYIPSARFIIVVDHNYDLLYDVEEL